MQADDIRLLFDYSYAATGRILDAASRLTTEEFTTPPPLHGAESLCHTLVHTRWAEQAWREGLRTRGAEEVAEFVPEAFPDVATLAQAWHSDDAQMRAWLDNIDDTDLSATGPRLPAKARYVCRSVGRVPVRTTASKYTGANSSPRGREARHEGGGGVLAGVAVALVW